MLGGLAGLGREGIPRPVHPPRDADRVTGSYRANLMFRRLLVILVSLFIATEAPSHAAPVSAPGAEMDYGPFLTSSLDRDPAVSKKESGASTEQTGTDANHLAAKSVNVRLHVAEADATVAFDTDLLRYVGGWTGGFLNLHNTHLTTEKGSVPPTPAGTFLFRTPLQTPGWAVG